MGSLPGSFTQTRRKGFGSAARLVHVPRHTWAGWLFLNSSFMCNPASMPGSKKLAELLFPRFDFDIGAPRSTLPVHVHCGSRSEL